MKKVRKGIILAGGKGSRLNPITLSVSKQLLPVYDKPMIYYPISNLIMAGIKEILLICDPLQIDLFKRIIKDGSQWGVKIKYEIQLKPEGIAQSFIIAEEFLDGQPVCLILGDNLFYGEELPSKFKFAANNFKKSTVFAYRVKDPNRYGIVEFDSNYNALNIQEKPRNAKSNFAVTGIYFYNNNVVDIAKNLSPSNRGELEISEINNILLSNKELIVNLMNRGTAWLDTGTFDSLYEAGAFIKTIENRQGLKVGCPEEAAFIEGLISKKELEKRALEIKSSSYGKYLLELIKNN
tara:strand:+ start:417 stop:1298 length:882 start_codon:yes stop_codon:yes gene_type:complete